jgi:hypothetical protein
LEETARAYAEGATQNQAEQRVSKLLVAKYTSKFDPAFPKQVVANVTKAYQVVAFAPN